MPHPSLNQLLRTTRLCFMRLLLLSLFALSVHAQRVMVIGIDGLSTAAFRNARLPHLRALQSRGASTLEARGVMPTVSSPNWASMLMGAGPEQHGITSNEWQRDKFDIPPLCQGPEKIFPNIFGVLKTARPSLKLAAIYDWDGFGRLLDRSAAHHAAHVLGSPQATEAAIHYWRTNQPDFLFVHLDDVDHAGHEHSWESPAYFAAADRIDQLVGTLVAAAGANTTILVVSDHGGTGKRHGLDNADNLLVPFIVAGPSIRPGAFKASVNLYDLAPTIARLFKVPPHPCWIGKSVL